MSDRNSDGVIIITGSSIAAFGTATASAPAVAAVGGETWL
jgi:hypothetical protein